MYLLSKALVMESSEFPEFNKYTECFLQILNLGVIPSDRAFSGSLPL
jgi:hypothetical protein